MATRDEFIDGEVKFFNKFYSYRYPDKSDPFYDHNKSVRLQDLLEGQLQISTFMENAIATQSGLKRMSTVGMDLDDGTEVKIATSSFRNNDHERGIWSHTYEIKNVHTKTGALRVIGRNILTEEFEYFFIPNEHISHLKNSLTLPIERVCGTPYKPDFDGSRKNISKWDKFQVPSFEDLCGMR